jgi:hypothetical protein
VVFEVTALEESGTPAVQRERSTFFVPH